MEGSPWGGSEELWAQSAVRLAKTGLNVSACTKHWPDSHPKLTSLKTAGVEVFERKHSSSFSDRVFNKFLGASRRKNIYESVVSSFAPQLIIVSNGALWPPDELIDAIISCKKPFITIAQAAHIEDFPNDFRADKLRSFMQLAETAVFISKENRALAELQLGEALPNAMICFNPFMVPFDINIDWPRNPPGAKDTRLACVARLHPASKGQDLLFQTLSRPKWLAREWDLSLYGEGPQENSLKRLSRFLGLEQRIRFNGHISDTLEIWQNNHALILPSRYEGLPLSIVEAMLCSRPVITTDVAGNAEFIEHGRTGFVAQYPSVESIDDALEEAWSKRRDWSQIGRSAGKAIRERIPRDPVGIFVRHILSKLCHSAYLKRSE
jgi:glycosyltransferase involved in cell wall biosynthesis